VLALWLRAGVEDAVGSRIVETVDDAISALASADQRPRQPS
jgi:hypothetical protein